MRTRVPSSSPPAAIASPRRVENRLLALVVLACVAAFGSPAGAQTTKAATVESGPENNPEDNPQQGSQNDPEADAETDAETDPGTDKAKPKVTVSALAFGDLFTVLAHHTKESEGAFGPVIRRIYLTLDGVLNKRLTARLRVEGNQCGEFECYGLGFDYKDVWLRLRAGEQKVTFGLQPSPTFDLLEELLGLRYLEKSPLDLQKIASRDKGVAAKGPLVGAWSYRAMIGTGLESGNKGDGPKYMMAATYDPDSPWLVDLFTSYERQPGKADRTTLQAIAFRQTEAWRFSLLYSYQDRQDNPRLEVGSFFAIYELSRRWNLIGRVDRLFEPSPGGEDIDYLPFDPTARATLLIAGAEARITRSFSLIPNVEIIRYDRPDSGGLRPGTDFLLRLTFQLFT